MVTNNSKKYDIVGIGNAIVDLIAEVDEEYLKKNNIRKGSMALLDFASINKLGSDVKIVKTISGGSAANTIVNISQQNLKTAFIGKVSNDDLGNEFAEGLRKEKVKFEITETKSNNQTARCLILVSPDAERSMNTYLGISQELSEQDVDMNIIKDSSILYLEGYLWDLDDAKKAITKSILKAQDCETMIAFSISDAFCVNRFRDEFYHIVNNSADIIFANELEIKSLFSTDKLEEAINKCQEIGKIFAITLGVKGAKLVHGKIIIDVKAEEIENLVDTTGAGDLFAAGFLAEYIKSQDLYRCLNRGVKMSSIIIQKFGARI